MELYALTCVDHGRQKIMYEDNGRGYICGICHNQLVRVKNEELKTGGENMEEVNEVKVKKVKVKSEDSEVKDEIAAKIISLLDGVNVDIKVKRAAMSRAYNKLKG